jgi:uncharacterized glyoxalase superfamily protein PhnB
MEQTVTPYLLYEDGEAAIDFLGRAFGFREVDRTTGAAGHEWFFAQPIAERGADA